MNEAQQTMSEEQEYAALEAEYEAQGGGDELPVREELSEEPEEPESPVKVTMNISQLARHLLTKTSMTGPEILAVIRAKFPDSRTGPASIAWYKNDLKKKGILVKSAKRFTAEINLTEFDE